VFIAFVTATETEFTMKNMVFTALAAFLFLPISLMADDYQNLILKALELASSDVSASKKDLEALIVKNPDKGAGYIAKGFVLYHYENDSIHAAELFRTGLKKVEPGAERVSLVELIDRETSLTRSQEESDFLKEAERARNANEPEKVISAITLALKLNPLNWKLHYEMGYALIEVDKHKDAIPYFEKGLAINPCSRLLLGETIYSYSHLADVGKVKKLIDQWNEYLDDIPSIHQEYAYACLKSGNRSGAVAALRENIKKYPSFLNSYYFLGEIHFDGGEYNEALPLLRKFVEGSAGQAAKNSWIEDAERMIDKCVESLNGN